jgi:hypothetical protein
MLAVSMLRVATLAPADDAPAARIRGTITAVSADALTVEPDSGSILDVTLRADRVLRAITLGSVEEIQPGRYIGTAAVPQADGTLKALEVHVFPPEMAGTGDGHRLWDLTPDSSMTNGVVGELLTSKGRIITVKYKDGEQKVVIPDGMPVVDIEPGDRSLLVPGAHVMILADRGAGGSLTERAISAGKDGVKPPM